MAVVALRCANSTGGWAATIHKRRVGVALPFLGPSLAIGLNIPAVDVASLARKRALFVHELGVGLAFAIALPVTARSVLVVAVTKDVRLAHGRKERNEGNAQNGHTLAQRRRARKNEYYCKTIYIPRGARRANHVAPSPIRHACTTEILK